MSTNDIPDFDWNQAASLLGDDPADVAEDMAAIVLELIEGAHLHIQGLKNMNPETERKAIGAEAHQLRGSLLNFGFTAVGAVLLQIEKGDYTPTDYPALVEKADVVFGQSKKLLAEHYPSLHLC